MAQGSTIYIYLLIRYIDGDDASGPSLLTRAGAQIITRFRRGCMENILRRSIPFFEPEQPLYTNSRRLVCYKEASSRLLTALRDCLLKRIYT